MNIYGSASLRTFSSSENKNFSKFMMKREGNFTKTKPRLKLLDSSVELKFSDLKTTLKRYE